MAQVEEQSRRYWAFVSYSHHDKRVARRLCSELGRRGVPRAFRNRVDGVDPRFQRIFLDEQESGAASELNAELRTALERSRKLIVICSPFAVASGYVQREIAYFQSLGRNDDILCIVASGVPNATDEGQPALECFPAPLRERLAKGGDTQIVPPEQRPLAATIGLESDREWNNAVDDLVAGLLDITKGDLNRLDTSARAKRYVFLGLGIAAIAASLAWTGWAYFLPHVTYAKGYVRRSGIWQEVDPISAPEHSHRDRSLRFERRGARGPLVAVSVVNAHDQCASEGLLSITGEDYKSQCSVTRACGVRFRNAEETMHDQYGNTLETLTYSLPSVAIVSEAVIGCSRARTGIKFVDIERSNDQSGPQSGFDVRLQFKGDDNEDARPNHDHAFGLHFVYDDQGRVKERWTLDELGQPNASADGPAGELLGYDSTGNIISRSFLDAHGHATKSASGFAAARYAVDVKGNRTRESFFNEDGQPAFRADGVSQIEIVRTTSGDPVNQSFFDAAGRATLNKEGYSQERSVYDAKGFRIQRQFYDRNKHPTPGGKETCFMFRLQPNVVGDAISTGCFDAAGQPATNRLGYHELRTTLGTRGDEERQGYWDVKGSPVNCSHEANNDEDFCPVQLAINTFDGAGNRVRERLYDADGSPSGALNGTVGWDQTFNDSGFSVSYLNIGISGLPVPDTNGIIGTRAQPDRFGRSMSEEYTDAHLQPLPLPDGILEQRFTYDDERHETKRELFDGAHHPTLDTSGVAGWTDTADQFGNIVLTRYIGLKGEPTRNSDGSFGERNFYDRYQRLIREDELNANGDVAMDDNGYASLTFDRDNLGNVIRVRFLDERGSPILNHAGVTGFDSDYDAFGYWIKRTYVGLSGEPAKNKSGVCIELMERDQRFRIIAHRFLDCAGHPTGTVTDPMVATTVFIWDGRDRETTEYYLGASGARVRGAESAGVSYKYDASDRVVEMTFLGVNGQPSASSSGDIVVRYTYDSYGHTIEEDSFGADYKFRHAAQREYDRFGHEVHRLLLGPGRKPAPAPESGRAEVWFKYDAGGRLLEERSLGTRSEPINRADFGWYRRYETYGASGQFISEHCVKVNGAEVKPCKSD